jgi:uncharacterized protein (TIGR02145 family)
MKKVIILLVLISTAVFAQEKGSFTDARDKKTYKTVKIGEQVWMAENLNYNAKGSKCYDNKESNCNKYGRLYDWNEAKKACPKGWHLPNDNDNEWDVLIYFAGGMFEVAGKKLKATNGWNDYEDEDLGKIIPGNGEDKFGFSALPGGFGSSDGSFGGVGSSGYWWSSSARESSSYSASSGRYMFYTFDDASLDDYDKYHLQSVRCLQD